MTPQFDVVQNGYDPAQVDAFLERIRLQTGGDGPARRILVTGRPVVVPQPAAAQPAASPSAAPQPAAPQPAATHPAAMAQGRRQSAERGETADEKTVAALRQFLATRHDTSHVDRVEDALMRTTDR